MLPEPIEFGPVTRTDLVRYAGASGDFNPLHHDADFARAAGLPDVMAHGMYSAGLMSTALVRWFGQPALKFWSTRFLAPVFPGDLLTARCLTISPGDAEVVTLTFGLFRGETEVLSGQAEVKTSTGSRA